MPTYNGWNVILMPTDPPAPASYEFQHNAMVGTSTNPFSGQQQVYDWNGEYMAASVSYATMTYAQAQAWVAFLQEAKGPLNVFQFNLGLDVLFNLELMGGSPPAPKYWRLQNNTPKWSVRAGKFYSVTFEVREAI